MKIDEKLIMKDALNLAERTSTNGDGGPFGAAVLNEHGEIISVASNSVLKDHDPTAHAEINAIRKACNNMGTHDLTGCTLYTTAFPCPMCLSAIIWSNIKNVVYGCRPGDADDIGFRDDFMYKFIQEGMEDKNVLQLDEKYRNECLKLFKKYEENEGQLY